MEYGAVLPHNEMGSGWNKIGYESFNVDYAGRGARQAVQVDLLRVLCPAR